MRAKLRGVDYPTLTLSHSRDFNLYAFHTALQYTIQLISKFCGTGQLVGRSTPRKGGARLRMKLVRGLKTFLRVDSMSFPFCASKILLFPSRCVAVQFSFHVTC